MNFINLTKSNLTGTETIIHRRISCIVTDLDLAAIFRDNNFTTGRVTINIDKDLLIVGSGGSVNLPAGAGLKFGEFFNDFDTITINLYGTVIGGGGAGAGSCLHSPLRGIGSDGGSGIANESTAEIYVNNYGAIYGGGGGGPGRRNYMFQTCIEVGGGGAPNGLDGDGSLTALPYIGGRGAVSVSKSAVGGGRPGEPGANDGLEAGFSPGAPGYVSTGLVTIANLNGGVTKGR